jgi:beta-galactosidase
MSLNRFAGSGNINIYLSMKHSLIVIFFVVFTMQLPGAGNPGTVINLNGTWEFDQTLKAFPPAKFTRKIQVPGLIHLAEPRIEEYDKFFKRPDKPEPKEQFNLFNLDYVPRYSWYRKMVFVPKELETKKVMITIKKSQYVTQVYINGMDLGTSMACYTPIEFIATSAIKYGENNEILIRVGERIWLPGEAAGSTDKEKEHYLPGIWDDVILSFSGDFRIDKLLLLPSFANKELTVKTLIRSFKPAQIYYGDPMNDSVSLEVTISDRISGMEVSRSLVRFSAKRDNLTEMSMRIPFREFKPWSPEKPYLYVATVRLILGSEISDQISKSFGMRDFIRKGKFFYLNGEKYILRGTNITLQRFFEDPDCGSLAWDKEWVKKLLIDFPKQLNWNAMRICVGIVPDFWYDIADEYGLLFQNEWFYWQNHGWDDQLRKEYSDWVWSDGTHPSIVIWDAINENTDMYIGNSLIPELKKLDPTRIWDAGYMREGMMSIDEMDEPHPYQGRVNSKQAKSEKTLYPLGNLDFKPTALRMVQDAGVPQLANEYGWIWLWRNGLPSKLTVDIYNYYLGPDSKPQDNLELQAYFLQLETEWLRSEPSLAGVLAFCYLTNNYGYTGDWFTNNIRDLKPSPTLEWFRHCFAPAAVFINLTDERYVRGIKPHQSGSVLLFNLAGINNNSKAISGKVLIKLLNNKGINTIEKTQEIMIDPQVRLEIPVSILLPSEPGGYLIVAEFTPDGTTEPVISRRYIKVGSASDYKYYEMHLNNLK